LDDGAALVAEASRADVKSLTPERWQQIKVMLYDALELPPQRRPEFLAEACSSDDSLRKEVESLLSLGDDEARSSLLESTRNRVMLPAGTKLREYEVQSLLGVGGMGEVYRAHDPRLGRDVAIKVLPSVFASDRDRLRRFEQEARAAAALNHPNILAIFDIGATGEAIPYVVSELLEGETLRERLRRGPLPVRKTVDLALQVTGGLAAAHEKGIIHRDLKPENLFLTTDGRLKILDFGLAKLTRGLGSSPFDAPTLQRETGAGVVLGTAGYMSPEQVRGLAVDQRSDIFAVGAIVYEMLSGVRAFHGDTGADTMNAILSQDAPPLSEVNPTIPPALERIVRRCLEKNPNERFHSIRDAAFALEAISDIPASQESGLGSAAKTIAPRRRIYMFWGLAVVLVIGLAAGFIYYRQRPKLPAMQEWEQVTNFADSAVFPALSPDGRMLAFLRGADTFTSSGGLYLKMLPSGEPVQLTHDESQKSDPAFSPDGSRITYSVSPAWSNWVVPVLGGKEQLMLPNASGLTWVDDRHILFSEIKSGLHMAIVTATESRAEERDVYVPPQDMGMAHRSYLSPDHRWVLVVEMGPPVMWWLPCRLVPFDGKSPGSIVGPPGQHCGHAAWSTDGKWMFFSADAGHGFHLWRQRFPDGEAEQLTFGPTEQEGIAVAPDGRSLLTSVGIGSSEVWVRDKSGERQIPFEGAAHFESPQFGSRAIFSPDGAKIYFLGRHSLQELEELWVADLASGAIERAVPGMSVEHSYDLSPDGKQIAFDSLDGQGQPHLWLASLDHRQPPRRLESDFPEANPLFGPGGVLFSQSYEAGHSYVYRRKQSDGEPQKVLSQPISYLHTISPDGKWVVAEAPVSDADATRGVMAYSVDDGSARRVCHNLCALLWTQDGKYLHIGLPGSSDSSADFRTFIVPLHHGDSFPELPAAGIKSDSDLVHLHGVDVVSVFAHPGPDGTRYAFERRGMHRNIYRIPIH
jgi:serine/threonine protein kinase/Tol biopolymer transport system component